MCVRICVCVVYIFGCLCMGLWGLCVHLCVFVFVICVCV